MFAPPLIWLREAKRFPFSTNQSPGQDEQYSSDTPKAVGYHVAPLIPKGERDGETSDYPRIASCKLRWELRCADDNGSTRGRLRGRSIPGRLCWGTGCCRRASPCLQAWRCRPPQGLLKAAKMVARIST